MSLDRVFCTFLKQMLRSVYSTLYHGLAISNIITTMSDLKNPSIPTCAIRLIKSYLTQRSMCIRYLGVESSFEKCPGGGPQGGLLTGLLFCLQVNKAGSPCPIPSLELPALENNHSPRMEGLEEETLRLDSSQGNSQWMDNHEIEEGDPSSQESYLEDVQRLYEEDGDAQRVNLPLCHNTNKTHKKACIDDLMLLEKISLSNLEEEDPFIGPPPFHGRFKLQLPPNKSILQHQLQDLVAYTKRNHMVLNSKKTKCIPFNNSRTKDFVPKFSVEEGTYLEVIYSLKVVGLVLNSELTWDSHIEYTVGRVKKVLWQLTRF